MDSIRDHAKWAATVITARREGADYLPATLRSLHDAGWDDVVVCAEPDAPVPSGVRLVRWSQPTGGPWPALRAALALMRVTRPEASMLAVFQDDIEVARDSRRYVQSSFPIPGILSLYTCRRLSAGEKLHGDWGMIEETKPRSFGSLGLVFPRTFATRLLHDPPAADRTAMDDFYVAKWCRQHDIPIWIHHPSLIRHVGAVSSLPLVGGVDEERNCASFLESC
jgi:hypothetical protein